MTQTIMDPFPSLTEYIGSSIWTAIAVETSVQLKNVLSCVVFILPSLFRMMTLADNGSRITCWSSVSSTAKNNSFSSKMVSLTMSMLTHCSREFALSNNCVESWLKSAPSVEQDSPGIINTSHMQYHIDTFCSICNSCNVHHHIPFRVFRCDEDYTDVNWCHGFKEHILFHLEPHSHNYKRNKYIIQIKTWRLCSMHDCTYVPSSSSIMITVELFPMVTCVSGLVSTTVNVSLSSRVSSLRIESGRQLWFTDVLG